MSLYTAHTSLAVAAVVIAASADDDAAAAADVVTVADVGGYNMVMSWWSHSVWWSQKRR